MTFIRRQDYQRLLPALKGLLSARFKILAYHSVFAHSRDPYEISAENFSEQMSYLAEHHFNVISLQQACQALVAAQIQPKTVVITFDDGFRSLCDYAFPLLERYAFPATVFVPFDYLGGIDGFSYARPRPDFEILNRDEIADSQAQRISYGSHSMSHRDLTALDAQQLHHELNESKKCLSALQSSDFYALAYPFGLFNDEVVNASRAAGYHCALCFGNVLSNSRYTSLLELKREKILNRTTLDDFKQLTAVEHDLPRKLRPLLAAARGRS